LARNDVDINSRDLNGEIPIFRAVQNRNESTVRLILTRDGVDIDMKYDLQESAFYLAATRGYESMVELLLTRDDLKVNADKFGHTLICAAVLSNNDTVVRLLLTRDDLDVNWRQRGSTPLEAAIVSDKEEIVEILLQRRDLKVNEKGQAGKRMLWIATFGKTEGMVRQLLTRENIDVNAQNEDKETPLSCALELGLDSIADLLKERGAHMNRS
jgi:ankyrin repeat protein